MKARQIVDGVSWVGAVDWDRRLFDSLIPLPDGTSYNAYLIQGSEKTALLDTVDPAKQHFLKENLAGVDKIDYVIAHHAEQDHSGSIPFVLAEYPEARVICSSKAKEMLVDHLNIPAERIDVVEDGAILSLGNKTLKFIYTPWVHWPETMSTYLQEDQILFSCDFFGAHLATSDLYVTNEGLVEEAAKRYYAEIMMPFRTIIQSNLKALKQYPVRYIAPSHGPIYDRPEFIIDAYWEWVAAPPKNFVVIPYTSMHDSTRKMVEHLVGALVERGVKVQQFDLADTDLGKLAIALVDAATIVIGTPTVLTGPHPNTSFAVSLTNALRPKLQFATVIGSYGWGGKTVEKITAAIPNLKAELLPPVLCKGLPKAEDLKALDDLAETIAQKHRAANLV